MPVGRKFDHELAVELYKKGAMIESLARKFQVSEQAIRFAVIPGEMDKQKRRDERRRQRRLLAAREAAGAEGVHEEV